ncbi:AzlC family ABC transporter permease [Dubosiella muris]|uniref:Branched-chain amino acid ABC transporter permease n=1 Tax=Dubosiella muris TaxID=3038133 RepID=A0AC61R8X3_9FIRM|nr:AzlC family ABC transporter permease [Dubosiella muris]TGY66768.1 branched-chain amino acid ABC transporter permease [Dubosiella muris]
MGKHVYEAMKATIPVMMGYIVLGFALGMLLQKNGYGWGYALLMSGLIYAGSMQFVAIDLLAGGASLISAALMTMVVNARHIVYGLSMIGKFKKMGSYKPYMIFSLTDETYSLLVGAKTPEGCEEKKFLFLVSLLDQCYWVLGSVAGSLIGSMLTINTTGLDFAMTALFVVIVVEQFFTSNRHRYSYLGFGVSAICLLFFGSASFLIPSMIGIGIGLSWLYGKEGKARE